MAIETVIPDFFVIEGLDGAGKSTIGSILTRIPQALFIDIPIPELEDLFGKVPEDLDGRVDFFMKNNLYYMTKLREDKLNFLYRYYPTTIIGNALHFGVDISVIEKMVQEYNLPEPIMTFLLMVDREEQLRRLATRRKEQMTEKDKNVLKNSDYNDKIVNYYLSEAKRRNWHIIDTTKNTPEKISEEILNKSLELYEHGRK